MKSLLKSILALLALVMVSSCAKTSGDPTLRALWLDRQAKQKVEKKQFEEAMATYYKMLESDPELAQVHSNIAILFLGDKKNDEALKSLQQALKLALEQKDATTAFVIYYNLGVYYGMQKKVPEALENYQAALEILPTSKETKTNIELLIQSNQNDKSKDGESKDSDKKDKGDQSKDNKDQKGKDDKNKDDQKDKKDDQKKDGKDKDDKDKKDDKDGKGKDDDKKEMEKSAKYKPRPFKGDQLSEGDVKKILGELKDQEQKIRANFDKKERKENKNEKDW